MKFMVCSNTKKIENDLQIYVVYQGETTLYILYVYPNKEVYYTIGEDRNKIFLESKFSMFSLKRIIKGLLKEKKLQLISDTKKEYPEYRFWTYEII